MAPEMSKIELLNAYLTERLAVVVKEILDVVGDTVTEYREETARAKRENEDLRRQLRDIVLLEAETDWLRSTTSAVAFAAPEPQSTEQKPRSLLDEPDPISKLCQRQPTSTLKQRHDHVVTVPQRTGRRLTPVATLSLQTPKGKESVEKQVACPRELQLKAEPTAVDIILQHEVLDLVPPLPSHPATNAPVASVSKVHIDPSADREEPQNTVPPLIKTEPEDYKVINSDSLTDCNLSDSVAPSSITESNFRNDHDRTVVVHLNLHDAQQSRRRSQDKSPCAANEGIVRVASPGQDVVHRCPRCRESFAQAISLRLHLEQKRKAYACEWCCKSFAQSADLRRHLRTHTGERPHRCTFCSKSFSQRGNLRRHLRIHTGERPYICPFCGRTFSDGDTMKKHKRTHSGERPFRCLQCSKTFISASVLQMHLKRDMCFAAKE